MNLFSEVRPISDVAMNILKKRYFQNGETTWEQLVQRVVNNVLKDEEFEQKVLTFKLCCAILLVNVT
jgi:hypothetical protein